VVKEGVFGPTGHKHDASHREYWKLCIGSKGGEGALAWSKIEPPIFEPPIFEMKLAPENRVFFGGGSPKFI
jgi:hypothetical protein